MKLKDILPTTPLESIEVRCFDLYGEDMLLGFCGWDGNKLYSLDGESYDIDEYLSKYEYDADGDLTYWVQSDIAQARKIIESLQPLLLIHQWDCIRKDLEFIIREVSKCIPAKPIRENWNPNRCPCCGADLGGECKDGYYQNPYYEICPECRQVLDYE